ncbi:MAG: hypothetical protein WD604_16475 [Balneolaceae bacterium]
MKLLLIPILMLAFSCHDLQAQSVKLDKSNGEATHLIHLAGEDQHGNRAGFSPPEEKPLLIFFLPKTESRTEAEALMDEVTAWFESVDGHTGSSVSKILVVEPYRTGLLVNRLFRSKMKDKPFPVIRDPEGEVVRTVEQNHYSIMLWLTDRNGNIVYKSLEPFSESESQKIKGLAGSVAVQN